MKTLDLQTAEEWRKWLAAYHDSESEAWLVFHKRHTGQTSIPYADALDQALCFGWVDSLIKRLDDARYARKFTPRKPDSRWSDANRKHYARLKASGQLMLPGLNRAPTNRRYAAKPQMPNGVPSYIQDALRKHAKAAACFESLAPSHRRRYVGWIHSAKQEETRMRRLQEAIRVLTAGKKLGLK